MKKLLLNKNNFYGVYAALLTPFDEKGEIDGKRLRGLIDFLIAKGINGFYICGGTGEGLSMDLQERKKVAEVAMDEIKGRAKLIIHVGSYSTKNAVELARNAEKIGVDAISSLPPLYYRYSEEEVFNYYREIAESTNLPFFMYYIPATTGIFLANDKIVQLGKIKNIVGLKYTHPDLHLLQDLLLKMQGKWIAFYGIDEMFLPGLTMGVVGCIGSTQNVLPELHVDIYKSFEGGKINEAMKLQARITTAVYLLKYKYGGLVSWKTALRFRGIDVGYCRPPLKRKLSREEEKKFLKEWKHYFPEFTEAR